MCTVEALRGQRKQRLVDAGGALGPNEAETGRCRRCPDHGSGSSSIAWEVRADAEGQVRGTASFLTTQS